MKYPSLMIIALAAAVAMPGLAASPAVADIAPHQALYSLSLGKATSSGNFSDVQGMVNSRIEKICDAWITTEQIKMRVKIRTGATISHDLTYTGWESADGKQYRFAASSVQDGQETRFRGRAWSQQDKPGLAVFSEPKKFDIALPPGTQFYFGLTAWLIEQAEAGAKRAETVTFDGTDEEGPQRVVAIIMPLKNKSSIMWGKFGALLDRPGWTVRLAFYAIDSKDAAPDYEVEAVILDNGVTPRMEMIFSEFTAIQKLVKIEALEGPEC